MTDSVLEAQLREWGLAKRRINGTQPAPRSIMGRIASEGSVGAAIRGQPPEPLEVMLGEALRVAIAIRASLTDGALSDKQYETLFIHYVCRGPVKAKLPHLSVSRQTYYKRLNGGRCAIAPYIDAQGGMG